MLYPHIDKYDINVPEDDDEVAGVTALLTVVVKDKYGNIKTAFTKPSHSPTYNFIALLALMGGIFDTFTDINGNTHNLSGTNWFYPTSLSIVVGSGTNSSPISSYKLAAQIPNGTGQGQLTYGNVNVSSTITVSGSSAYFSIYNTFGNASNVTVTVTEIGIMVSVGYLPCSTCDILYFTILVWYDTISAISLAPGDTLTVTYTFTANP